MPNFTTGTRTFTVYQLTPTGPGCWYAEQPVGSPVFQIRYSEALQAPIESARPLLGFDTFRELLTAMFSAQIPLPNTAFIDVEASAEEAGVQAQFHAVTDAELRGLANFYGAEALCIALGAFAFVDRYYLLGTIDLAAVARIFYNFRDTGRANEAKVRARLDWLLANNHINQAQYDGFWNNW